MQETGLFLFELAALTFLLFGLALSPCSTEDLMISGLPSWLLNRQVKLPLTLDSK